MRKAEKWLFSGTVIVLGGMMLWNARQQSATTAKDTEIPFYSTASQELKVKGAELYRRHQCKKCHSLWAVRDMMQSVPAPALDGIGSLRSREWLLAYFSAEDPQSMVHSRLKKEYRMPSYASLPLQERQLLADYMSSLKVKNWYLTETRKAECRKLTGEAC